MYICVTFVLFFQCLIAQIDPKYYPPRAWNSYDAFPVWEQPNGFNEAVLLQQAAILSTYRTTGQFTTLIIDEGWAENNFAWILDNYGRPTVNPMLFPSAQFGEGFAPLAAKLKAEYGLSLGLWIMRGITKQAVELNLPINGFGGYKARDIALTNVPCKWHTDMYAINMSHPGGKAFYDSLIQLYSSWGVDYLKVDCIFGGDLDRAEVIGLSESIASYGGNMRLSLSPGGPAVNIQMANTTGRYANLYRITGDLWDCWAQCADMANIVNTTRELVAFQSMLDLNTVGRLNGKSFPDPDMIALGVMGLPSKHQSALTVPNLARYVYCMWSITRSPIVIGGDLTTIKAIDWLDNLLSNSAIAAMSINSASPIVASFVDVDASGDGGYVVWRTLHGTIPNAFYVGFFAFSNNAKASYSEQINATWAQLHVVHLFTSISSYEVYDVVAQQWKGSVTPAPSGSYNVNVPANDCVVQLFVPSGKLGRKHLSKRF